MEGTPERVKGLPGDCTTGSMKVPPMSITTL